MLNKNNANKDTIEIDKNNPFSSSNELDNNISNSANTTKSQNTNKTLHFNDHFTTHELSDNDSITAAPNVGTTLNESGTFGYIELDNNNNNNNNNEVHEMKKIKNGYPKKQIW